MVFISSEMEVYLEELFINIFGYERYKELIIRYNHAGEFLNDFDLDLLLPYISNYDISVKEFGNLLSYGTCSGGIIPNILRYFKLSEDILENYLLILDSDYEFEMLVNGINVPLPDWCSYVKTVGIENIWYNISGNLTLPEGFIDMYRNKIDFDVLSCNHELSIKFLDKFKGMLNWKYLCCFQVLTEEMLNRYKDYLDFDMVLKHQSLSKEFKKNIW